MNEARAGRGSSLGSRLFSFPDPVNEVAARLVAGGVMLLSLAAIALEAPALILLIAYGFLARVAAGPTLSPLALIVTKLLVPRLPLAERPVPGPPKRFAQAIGAALSCTAAVLAFAFGLHTVAYVLMGGLAFAAGLESVLGLCLGCKLFAQLMRAGLIPSEVCERCVGPQPVATRRPPAEGRAGRTAREGS